MQKSTLRRELGIVYASALALGAIIGAGIFVTISEAAKVAGASFLLAIPLAALVALLSGLSATELGITFPRSGGTYLFAGQLISRGIGFLAGWIFLLAGITASSTYILAFTGYIAPILPEIPPQVISLALIAIATAIGYTRISMSAAATTFLVAVKIIILLIFILIAAPSMRFANLRPLFPVDAGGLLQATALMFFAFAGFARPVTLAEEIRRPKTTLPASLVTALSVSLLLYLLTAGTATGVLGPERLAQSSAPLSFAALRAAGRAGEVAISIGALISILSVLLTEILGLSRIVFAMSRNGDIPDWFAVTHPTYHVPHRAVLLVGVTVAVLTTITDLSFLLAASSLALLLYYGLTNFTALRLREKKLYSPIVSLAGLTFTFVLALTLPMTTIAIHTLVIVVGAFYYYVIRMRLLRARDT